MASIKWSAVPGFWESLKGEAKVPKKKVRVVCSSGHTHINSTRAQACDARREKG
jgi:hypothetical protein